MAGGKLLAGGIIVYLIIDVLLTPLGFETRTFSNFTNVGYATLGLLFIGIALLVISLILLAVRPNRSPMLAVVGGLLYFPIFLADQSGQFSTQSIPTTIGYIEYVQALVAIVVILLALQFRRKMTHAA